MLMMLQMSAKTKMSSRFWQSQGCGHLFLHCLNDLGFVSSGVACLTLLVGLDFHFQHCLQCHLIMLDNLW